MCNDGGICPGGEAVAIAIIYATHPSTSLPVSASTSSSTLETSSRAVSPLASSSEDELDDGGKAERRKGGQDTARFCSRIQTSMSPIPLQYGLTCIIVKDTLRNEPSSRRSPKWSRLGSRLNLDASEGGIMGCSVSIMCDGVEIGRGVGCGLGI